MTSVEDGRRLGTVKERQAVASRLRDLVAKVDQLLECVDGRQLSEDDESLATSRLVDLKDQLESESREMSTGRGKAAMSPAELAFYRGTIRRAFRALKIKRGGKPRPEWRTPLYSVRLELTHSLDGLEATLKPDLE
jgi:hypothetical protein